MITEPETESGEEPDDPLEYDEIKFKSITGDDIERVGPLYDTKAWYDEVWKALKGADANFLFPYSSRGTPSRHVHIDRHFFEGEPSPYDCYDVIFVGGADKYQTDPDWEICEGPHACNRTGVGVWKVKDPSVVATHMIDVCAYCLYEFVGWYLEEGGE